ncbi:MAG: MOSC domain-containing protein [Pseudobdellovibrionaceae bacterium]
MRLQIKKLSIYPIKSCHGLDVTEFQIGESGPQIQIGKTTIGDREWMFVDSEGKFVTQRTFPKMALLKPVLQDQRFYLEILGSKFEIPIQEKAVPRKTVSVWGKDIDAALIESPLNEAVSDFLNQNLQLMHFDSVSNREILVKGKGMNAQTRFTDSQAYLIFTEESLKDLNSKMKEPIGPERFRGNILLSGAEKPYAEDDWQILGSDRVAFEMTKACARCKIITVDQDKGEIPSSEPLQVLAKHRRRETAVYFGQYFLSRSYGEILKVGDQLLVGG